LAEYGSLAGRAVTSSAKDAGSLDSGDYRGD
jgi:hypothetical protein